MSLKSIKEALDLLETHIADNGPCDHSVNICSCGERQSLADAREQIAEVEKAAHMVTVVGQSEATADRYPEWVAACELLRSIAKEAE